MKIIHTIGFVAYCVLILAIICAGLYYAVATWHGEPGPVMSLGR